MVIKVFLEDMTAGSRALMIFFALTKIKASGFKIDLKGDRYPDEYLEICPEKNHIPLMRENDLIMSDPIQIMKHLLKRHKPSPNNQFYPFNNILERLEVDKVHKLYRTLISKKIPKIHKKLKSPFSQFTASKLVHFSLDDVSKIKTFLVDFEQLFLKSGGLYDQTGGACYLVDKGLVTIVDIFIFCDIMQFMLVGVDVFGFGRLGRWLNGLLKHEIFVRVHTKLLLFAQTTGRKRGYKFEI